MTLLVRTYDINLIEGSENNRIAAIVNQTVFRQSEVECELVAALISMSQFSQFRPRFLFVFQQLSNFETNSGNIQLRSGKWDCCVLISSHNGISSVSTIHLGSDWRFFFR